MPSYMITDNQTGKKFKVTGDSPPSESESAMIFQRMGGDTKQQSTPDANYTTDPSVIEQQRRKFEAQEDNSTLGKVNRGLDTVKNAIKPKFMQSEEAPTRKTLATFSRPLLEGGLALGGGIVGSGVGPAGTIGGAAIGYASGKNIADTIEGNYAKTPQEAATRTLKDLGTGAMYEIGGQAVAPALSMMSRNIGKVAKPVLGRLSGTGQAPIDEAISSGMQSTNSMNPLKSTTSYDKALRGKISGEEIVDNARNALTRIKDARTTAYQANLQQVTAQNKTINLTPINQEIQGLMGKYNIKLDTATGAIDTSRIAMGKTGRKDIEEIIDTVSNWGTQQGDNTAMGLDTLKRQLDDFYSDSSQARQFVAQLRNKVKDTIIKDVPQYDKMTKGYTEATKIIKDVEAGLMLRKNGMSGRVVAEQTLRRLMSSMRDNFALRKELVDVLGKEGGEDLGAMIAGYTQNSVVPVGLAGTGPALLGSAALAKYFDPTFASVIVASSPRVQGEFFRMLGKGIKTAKAVQPAVPAVARQAAITVAQRRE